MINIKRLESWLKTDVRYIAKSGFWLNLSNLVSTILSFILTILFAHFLSQDIYGIYKYILATASIAAAFSLTGMNVATMRAAAQGFSGIFTRSIIEQFKWSWLQFSILIAIGLYYFWQGNSIYGIAFLVISLLAPLSGIANTFTAILYGTKEFKNAAIYSIISNCLYFVVMAIIVWQLPFSILALIIGYYFITTASNVYFCIRTYKKYNLAADTAYRQEDISYGKHMSVMNSVSTIANQIDNVIVYHLLGPASLALYSFAIVIPDRIRVLFGFIATAAFPKIAEKDLADIRPTLKRKILQLVFIALAIALIYIIAAPFIFKLIFPQYIDAVIYSQIFSLSLVAIATNISLTTLLAQKLQTELYYVNVYLPAIKIGIIVIAIWQFGIWGAIVARIIGHLLLLLSSTYFLKKNVQS